MNARKDGLDLDQARRTAEYVCGKRDVALVGVRGWMLRSIGTMSVDMATAIQAVLADGHGFGVVAERNGDACALTLDLSACPDDVHPGEREQIANFLSKTAEADMRAELEAGEGATDLAMLCQPRDMGRQERSWCMQQTIVFLRQSLRAALDTIATNRLMRAAKMTNWGDLVKLVAIRRDCVSSHCDERAHWCSAAELSKLWLEDHLPDEFRQGTWVIEDGCVGPDWWKAAGLLPDGTLRACHLHQ